MEFLFDHYKKIKDPILYLHNPDMKPISAIKARNRNFVLRFNDLSELTFEAPKYEKNKDGTTYELPYYSRFATKRLIKIDELGWFQITQAVEHEDGLTAYMAITAQSHQCAFKEKGFFCEGRLYKFYDETDPTDAHYDSDKEDAIPSVVGQLYQQLGIKVAVAITDFEPDTDYGDWTIVYIDPVLKYVAGAENNICRAFKENSATYGYDFMVNSVENAFEVIFDFDFMHHAIKVKRVESVTQKTNIYLSFDNVVNELQTTEKADDIVTVLNCSGTDLDIRTVNPTGTNYIVDFSYYMDEVNYHWMSKELIDKIKDWKALVDSKKAEYTTLVTNLRNAYESHTTASSDIVYVKRKNQDLEAVRDQYIVDTTTANMLFVAETVEVGKKSYDSRSPYYSTALSENDQRTCYSTPPSYNGSAFVFSGSGTTATLKSNMQSNKLYFMDYSGNTYCKIVMGSKVVNGSEVNYVASIERYTVYSAVSGWLTIYGNLIDSKQKLIDTRKATADGISAQMQAIADEVNILKYFSSTPVLMSELRNYWIEGDYNNEHLAVLDSTKPEEAIDLARELLSCGEKELARVCQPRFSVAVSSIKFIKIYAFRKFMYELALGKVITVEKTKDVYYYPALTQMSFSLENDDSFELVFSNALKLNDWGFTYADLIASASNTSKNVISNWNELMDYSTHKSSIQELLLNPLDTTLRLAEKNMNNQEFVVDNTGILGRKRKAEDLFEDEQVRMINNVILFTDDSWQTVKTALGKVSYTDYDGAGNPVQKKAYGLLAEVIVGSLMMSNQLKISNDGGFIILDQNGITIKNKASGNVVFTADTFGDVEITGIIHATGGDIGALTIAEDGSITSDNGNFCVKSAGNIIAKGGGSIGGFSIGDTSLTSGNVGMSSDKTAGAYAFWAGSTTPSSAYFSVTNEGALYATNARIQGKIDATSGTIGAFAIANNGLESPYIKINAQSIYFPTDAVFNLSDKVNIYSDSTTSYIVTSGERDFIIKNTSGAGIKFYKNPANQSRTITVTLSNFSTRVESKGGYGVSLYHVYLDYSYTLSAPLSISTTCSFYTKFYQPFTTQTVACSVTLSSVSGLSGTGSILLDNDAGSGKPRFDGVCKTQNGTFTTGSLSYDAQYVSVTNNILYSLGSFCPETNSTGMNSGFTLGDTSHRWNSVVAYTSDITVSDRNHKHNIADIPDDFEAFFDDLRAVTFVYNEADSGRTHLGFIAQEVEDSLAKCGISTQNFAGICISRDAETQKTTYSLRYEEFIPLNTLEIQKLKARVAELEKEIKELKGEN